MTTHTIDLEHKALTMTDNLNAKILRFVAYDLGRHVTLMLTFQPPQLGILYKDTFPLWTFSLFCFLVSYTYLSFRQRLLKWVALEPLLQRLDTLLIPSFFCHKYTLCILRFGQQPTIFTGR